MRLYSFSDIGSLLRKRYDTAQQVTTTLEPSEFRLINPKGIIQPDGLLYYESSPNPCEQLGLRPSSRGRECNSDSLGSDGCDQLCCGRGFRTEKRTILKNCKCSFKWCCEVSCSLCAEQVNVDLCI